MFYKHLYFKIHIILPGNAIKCIWVEFTCLPFFKEKKIASTFDMCELPNKPFHTYFDISRLLDEI